MRKVPALIYAVEQLIFHGNDIPESELSIEDFKNYEKIKNVLDEGKNVDSRRVKINIGFKKRLYALIFGFQPSKYRYSVMQRNIIEIIKQRAVAALLFGLASPKSGIEVYKSIFKRSKKYQFAPGIFESSRYLFAEEAKKGNISSAKNYFEECQSALMITQNEIKVEWYSAELRNHFAKKKEITKELGLKAKSYFEELDSIEDAMTSRLFNKKMLTVGIIYYESEFDYVSLCAFLAQKLDYFKTNYHEDWSSILMLYLYRINYLIRIKELNEAENEIALGFELAIPKSRQWFRLNELKMLWALRKGNTHQTIRIFQELSEESQFATLTLERRNHTELTAWYAIISEALKGGKSKGSNMLKKYRLGRYLNSIPDFYMDKKGMNVGIIIVQLLYYIILRDLEKLDSRFDAVEKYLSRYMRSNPLYRSHCFVKMLLQVPKQNFHPVAIKRHSKKHFENLKSLPFLKSHHPNELELIEYDILWDQLMHYLKGR